MINYNIRMDVESPVNSKEPYSEIKVVECGKGIDNGNGQQFNYEDKIVKFAWIINEKSYSFLLINKTQYTIKMNWDDIVYVNMDSLSERMIHKDIPYPSVISNTPQVSSSVPRGAKYSDYLIPASSIFVEDEEDNEYDLNQIYYASVKEKKANKEIQKIKERLIGKTVSIQIPLVIEDTQNNYIFSFYINDISLSDKTYKEFSRIKTTWAIVGGSIGAVAATLIGCMLAK
jgi:hypothetical protein